MNAYLTKEQAIQYTGRTYGALKYWAKTGKVKTRKDKGRVKYRTSDLSAEMAKKSGQQKKAIKVMPSGEQRSDSAMEVDQLTPPAWLSSEAADIFQVVCDQIKHYQNHIEPADIHGLAMCAKYLAEFQLCEQKIQKAGEEDPVNGGLVTVDKNKSTRIHPLARHQRFCAEMFFQYSARYGLTPSDRESLKIVVNSAAKGSSGESVR